MGTVRRYEFEGVVIEIPVHYDSGAGIYIEDYPDFAENPIWTEKGHQVMFVGEDACLYAEEKTEGGCPDCGSCKHYESAGEHTWFGICKNKKRSTNIISETREGKLL